VLKLDEHSFRRTWVVSSADGLTTLWANITNEYREFYEQREAYEHATDQPDETPSGSMPRIWVGSLADYNNGDLHGAWFDATCEPQELEQATEYMLRLGQTPDAEEWAIMDYDGFAGVELGGYESFATISRVAQGIAAHGEAFGHWAAHVGSEDPEQLDGFAGAYRSEWSSFEAYVEDYLQETGFYQFLDQVPEDMRGYIEVDAAQIARNLEGEYVVVELGSGKVLVFEMSE
jgi:antirestriction protein